MYPLRFIFDEINKGFYGESSTSFFGDLVDRTKYDVIEKPEWKKKRIAAQVETTKINIKSYQEIADSYLKRVQEAEESLKKLEEELANVEKKD